MKPTMKSYGAYLLVIAVTASRLLADQPPNPCAGAMILPSQIALTYHGLMSGCTESGGTCTVGETISFSAPTTYTCVLEDAWQFPDGPVLGFTTVNHVFATAGTFTISMTAYGENNSVTLSKTVTVAPNPNIPALSMPLEGLLFLLIALVAVQRLR